MVLQEIFDVAVSIWGDDAIIETIDDLKRFWNKEINDRERKVKEASTQKKNPTNTRKKQEDIKKEEHWECVGSSGCGRGFTRKDSCEKHISKVHPNGGAKSLLCAGAGPVHVQGGAKVLVTEQSGTEQQAGEQQHLPAPVPMHHEVVHRQVPEQRGAGEQQHYFLSTVPMQQEDPWPLSGVEVLPSDTIVSVHGQGDPSEILPFIDIRMLPQTDETYQVSMDETGQATHGQHASYSYEGCTQSDPSGTAFYQQLLNGGL